jgi:hypothetical protein
MPLDTTIVRCPDCGETRKISVRQKRRLINGHKAALCEICRTIPSSATYAPSHANSWLDRYDVEWIRETAAMIWPEDSS